MQAYPQVSKVKLIYDILSERYKTRQSPAKNSASCSKYNQCYVGCYLFSNRIIDLAGTTKY